MPYTLLGDIIPHVRVAWLPLTKGEFLTLNFECMESKGYESVTLRFSLTLSQGIRYVLHPMHIYGFEFLTQLGIHRRGLVTPLVKDYRTS